MGGHGGPGCTASPSLIAPSIRPGIYRTMAPFSCACTRTATPMMSERLTVKALRGIPSAAGLVFCSTGLSIWQSAMSCMPEACIGQPMASAKRSMDGCDATDRPLPYPVVEIRGWRAQKLSAPSAPSGQLRNAWKLVFLGFASCFPALLLLPSSNSLCSP